MSIDVNTTNSLISLDRQISATFLEMKQAQFSTVADQISFVLKTSKRKVDLPIFGAVGNPRVWSGPRVIKGVTRDGFTVTTQPFENSIGIDCFDLTEDTIRGYDMAFRNLVTNGMQLKDMRIAQFLEAGQGTTFGVGYDQVSFFNASHPIGQTANTFSNYTTGASPAWYLFDTTKMPTFYVSFMPFDMVARLSPNDPKVFDEHTGVIGTSEHAEAAYGNPAAAHKSLATLDEAGLTAAITAMRSRVNEQGNSLGITPNLLVVSPANEFAAAKLLTAAYNAAGATNVLAQRLQYAVWNKLTGV